MSVYLSSNSNKLANAVRQQDNKDSSSSPVKKLWVTGLLADARLLAATTLSLQAAVSKFERH